jgi:localization factor PodJL
MSRLGSSPPPTAEAPATANEAPSATVPAKPPAGRQSALIPGADGASAVISPSVLLAIETARQAMAAPIPKPANAATVPEREVTGSLAQPAKPEPPAAPTPAPASSSAHSPPAPAPVALAPTAPAPAAPAPLAPAQSAAIPAATGGADKLPAAIGGALRAAALKGDAAAQFEVAQRYAEGRGIPQNFAEAAEWFDRAAKQGLLPAHFRLGGLYEKGLGVKKNLDTARRFYLTAGEAGNAKALHNLAVLYAEGIDGKPDYLGAAKWFRKAAGYGIADSQYNLGILYARGIGVEQNLAEAYRWFALAAREGDREAAKKRDDVGARLDERSLTAAQAAVQAWTPEPQPEAALQVKTPPGGWDTAVATQPAPKRKPPVVGPKLDLSIPRLAQ